MIKLVPQPHYHEFNESKKLALFLSELNYFDEVSSEYAEEIEGEDIGEKEMTASSSSGACNPQMAYSLLIRRIQLLLDEMTLTLETHNLHPDFHDKVELFSNELAATQTLHKRQGPSEDVVHSLPALLINVQQLACLVEVEAKEVKENLDPCEPEAVSEEEYMLEQKTYCLNLWASHGELIFNAIVIYSPVQAADFRWFKARIAAKLTYFDLGHGYSALLVPSVASLVSLLAKVTLPQYCKFLMHMQNSTLSTVLESEVRDWMPMVALHDTFFRLATSCDNLLAYPVVHSDFPSSSSDDLHPSSHVIFKHEVRYSDPASNDLDAFFRSLQESEDTAVPSSPLAGVGAASDGNITGKKKKMTEDKVMRKALREAREALPEGWQAAYDATSHNVYFCNPATGLSQWTRPA